MILLKLNNFEIYISGDTITIPHLFYISESKNDKFCNIIYM